MSAAKRQLKLGAVTYGVGGPGSPYLWLDEDIPLDASVNINWYIEQARLAEAAKFDLIFIVDSQFITADSPPHYLNRLEPLTLLSALAVSTTHLGLVATMTTSYNDPFNIARRLASLELISGGRSSRLHFSRRLQSLPPLSAGSPNRLRPTRYWRCGPHRQ